MALVKNNVVFNTRYVDPIAGNKGRLKVDVFDTNGGKPVENAKVDIFATNSNGEETQIESITTDISGQTLDILLDAPPKEYSYVPQEDVRPYSLYNVKIFANDFKPMYIKGVEILADSKAIQNVNLHHVDDSSNSTEVISIQDNTLWGNFPPKIPEPEVKELPPATGFVVLDEPVVPEFIVVHDGPPDAIATNYYVPFTDYIKNVASSEIYSTWPQNTLRANIFAIISFTLNRVFTEWYRGQGKNFTITSSTDTVTKWG